MNPTIPYPFMGHAVERVQQDKADAKKQSTSTEVPGDRPRSVTTCISVAHRLRGSPSVRRGSSQGTVFGRSRNQLDHNDMTPIHGDRHYTRHPENRLSVLGVLLCPPPGEDSKTAPYLPETTENEARPGCPAPKRNYRTQRACAHAHPPRWFRIDPGHPGHKSEKAVSGRQKPSKASCLSSPGGGHYRTPQDTDTLSRGEAAW